MYLVKFQKLGCQVNGTVVSEPCIWSGRDWRSQEQVIRGARRALRWSPQPNISAAQR